MKKEEFIDKAYDISSDFEKEKPNHQINPHLVPVYLFFKFAKEFGCNPEYVKEIHDIKGIRFYAEKDLPFPIWFCLTSSGPLNSFLSLSLSKPMEPRSDDSYRLFEDDVSFIQIKGCFEGGHKDKSKVSFYLSSVQIQNDIEIGGSFKRSQTIFRLADRVLSEFEFFEHQ